MKRYEEIRKLITEQGKDWKELDSDPKAIQKTEFAWQLKKLDAGNNPTDAEDNDQCLFVLTF